MTTIYPHCRRTLLLLFVGILSSSIIAQDQRFNIGLIAGGTYSVNEYTTLDAYYGINAGLLAHAKLSNKFHLGIELLYDLNGEYITPESLPEPTVGYGKMKLHHVVIPLFLRYNLQEWKKAWRYRLTVNAGFAFSQLFDYSAKDDFGNSLTNQMEYNAKVGLLAQVGTTYYFTDKLGVNSQLRFPIKEKGLGVTIVARVIYLIF